MVDATISHAMLHLNGFPTRNGASNTMSPRTIVTGLGKLDATKHCKLEFGEYCEIYMQPTITNNMNSRSTPGIALYPANDLGGYFFMNLESGECIMARQWTKLPAPAYVIRAVERLAQEQYFLNGHQASPLRKMMKHMTATVTPTMMTLRRT
mmetsp:Transcript_25361/g.69904  ORF Transcript_25361/g.69904 Transcript_25361/m.69904 type:complete len:152 (+) Transcript_25361:1483-1938(+)